MSGINFPISPRASMPLIPSPRASMPLIPGSSSSSKIVSSSSISGDLDGLGGNIRIRSTGSSSSANQESKKDDVKNLASTNKNLSQNSTNKNFSLSELDTVMIKLDPNMKDLTKLDLNKLDLNNLDLNNLDLNKLDLNNLDSNKSNNSSEKNSWISFYNILALLIILAILGIIIFYYTRSDTKSSEGTTKTSTKTSKKDIETLSALSTINENKNAETEVTTTNLE
jgi:hypothetical protein